MNEKKLVDYVEMVSQAWKNIRIKLRKSLGYAILPQLLLQMDGIILNFEFRY
jgi:hypothetical protein